MLSSSMFVTQDWAMLCWLLWVLLRVLADAGMHPAHTTAWRIKAAARVLLALAIVLTVAAAVENIGNKREIEALKKINPSAFKSKGLT